MDVVIPLGNGSRWQNNEIRYCLRSIQKHLIGYDRIFIVGEKPDFLRYGEAGNTILHIPVKPDTGDNKERDYNIFRKLWAAVQDSRLTYEFLQFDDDYYLLQDVYHTAVPPYHKGLLSMSINRLSNKSPFKPAYVKTMMNTQAKLAGYVDVKNFDVHAPFMFSKARFQEIFEGLSKREWPAYGYGIRTLWGTWLNLKGEEIEDLKFTNTLDKGTIYETLKGRPFFSTGNKCMDDTMKEVLQELYPVKSKYEI